MILVETATNLYFLIVLLLKNLVKLTKLWRNSKWLLKKRKLGVPQEKIEDSTRKIADSRSVAESIASYKHVA